MMNKENSEERFAQICAQWRTESGEAMVMFLDKTLAEAKAEVLNFGYVPAKWYELRRWFGIDLIIVAR